MKPTKLPFCLYLFLSLLPAGHATEKPWFGGSADWADAANWMPSGVHLDTDAVLISSATPNLIETLNLSKI